ncbi:hypothetical protein [uncultured Draconibacterium sp.]|uniref:hypothetical protein n=1 Tax=uncultured Draconibacterium sp. TaxID=1573823 RepID=UPI0025EC8DDE|nr:hypothetical protein [uncultured Draconibacterium sp.]
MKKLFYLNRRWSNAAGFFLFNLVVCFLLMIVLSAFAENLKHSYLWSLGILLGFGLMINAIVITLQTQVKEVEIEKDCFILHFFLLNQKKYRLDQLKQYATAVYGNGRYIMAHSVILEFDDGKRYQVADPIIDNYKDFYEFIKAREFECFGYIGQNNWRKKNKPFSKKWVVERNEKELIKTIEKKKGVIILYIYGIIALAMNYAMVRYLMF